jgi:hypothetical protein
MSFKGYDGEPIVPISAHLHVEHSGNAVESLEETFFKR